MAEVMRTSTEINEKSNEVSLVSLKIKEGDYPLEHRYAVWVCPRRKGGRVQNELAYVEQLRIVTKFETFWAIYSHMKRPDEISDLSDVFVFKDGIRPMWEDESNKNGGRLSVHTHKRNSPRIWESLLMALIGEQLALCCSQICGIALSPKPHDDIISVWCRGEQCVTSDDSDAASQSSTTSNRDRIKSSFMRVLNLPANTQIDYRPHASAMTNTNRNSGPPRNAENPALARSISTGSSQSGAMQSSPSETEQNNTK